MTEAQIMEKYSDHYIFSGKNKGNIKEFKGKVNVNVIYVSDATHPWDEASRAAYEKKVEQAKEMLVSQAFGYKADISVRIVSKSYTSTYAYDPLRPAWLIGFYLSEGVISLSAYQRKFKEYHPCDEAPVLFVFNRALGAYALRADIYNEKVGEYSVVGNNDTADTIVHELLHQFGAPDYYMPPEARTAADKYLPGTVMVNGNVIDELTGYIIGWSNSIADNGVKFLDAVSHYTRADCMRAKLERAKNYKNVSGVPTDDNGEVIVSFKSFDDMLAAARNKHAYAAFLVGYCYRYGILVEKNIEKAIKWTMYTKSITNTPSIALYAYACDMTNEYDSRNSTKTLTEEEKLSVKDALVHASVAGHLWAMNNLGVFLCLGRYLNKDERTGMEYRLKACEPGISDNVIFEYKNACYYCRNIPELHRAVSDQAKRYETACIYGDSTAQRGVVNMLQEGKLVPRDLKKAFEMCKLGAGSGDRDMLYQLAYCYEKGLGTPVNLALAEKYYSLGEKEARKAGSSFDRDDFKRIFKREN